MKQMPAAKFKAQCLSVMAEIQATGEPVLVTKRGKPVARVMPVLAKTENLFGFMADKVRIVGDIESPIPVDWETGEA